MVVRAVFSGVDARTSEFLGFDGIQVHVDVLVQADNGELATSLEGTPDSRLTFYRPDCVLISGPTGTPLRLAATSCATGTSALAGCACTDACSAGRLAG
jgi:hypothetical protein